MRLARTPEPELMDTTEQACAYDGMDHRSVNAQFVSDLLAVWTPPEGAELVDLGTGTARIPIELCRRAEQLRVVAVDFATAMLYLAKVNIELDGLADRIRLDRLDAKQLEYPDQQFDGVLSNSLIHHMAEPSGVLREAVRIVKPEGLIFIRDLLRPSSAEAVDRLVELYAADEQPTARAAFRASLHAALTLEEIRELVEQSGGSAEAVHRTSDRHWTWCQRIGGENRR